MIDETAREIREMRTHSSSTVAMKAALALQSLYDREYQTPDEFLRALEQNSKVLRQANPSHAWLQSSQRRIVSTLQDSAPSSTDEAVDQLDEVVSATVERIERATDEAGRTATALIEDGDTILTHDFSNTVLAAIKRAATDAELHLYVTEARPRFMGRRMARTAAQVDGVDVTLIVDNAAGQCLPSCDHVLVGMDCIVDDRLYNRVGTFQLAAAAAITDVPVSTLGAAAKVIDHGFRFENDYRDAVEVMREPTTEFGIENPAYDATPLELLDSVVTDEGIRSV